MSIYEVLGNVLKALYVLKKLIIVTNQGIVRYYYIPTFQKIRHASKLP